MSNQQQPSPETQAHSHRLFQALQSYQVDLREVLHDELCQSLGSALLMARILANKPPRDVEAAFEELGLLIAQAVENARSVAHRLSPLGSGPGALMEGLGKLALSSPIPCKFVCEEPAFIRDTTHAMAIYRLAEAALSVANKTSGTTQLTLTLVKNEQSTPLELCLSGAGARSSKDDLLLSTLAIPAGAILTGGNDNAPLCWQILYQP